MSSGYSIDRVAPGRWYQGVFAGGFSDAQTGIHVPGPIVELDKDTRKPVRIVHLPDPVQIPHKRVIQRIDERGHVTTEEVAMDYSTDEHPSALDGLHLALQCGQIREVPAEEMQRRYPDAFADKREDRVYDPTPKAVSMTELLDQFYSAAERSNGRAADADAARREADAALSGKSR